MSMAVNICTVLDQGARTSGFDRGTHAAGQRSRFEDKISVLSEGVRRGEEIAALGERTSQTIVQSKLWYF